MSFTSAPTYTRNGRSAPRTTDVNAAAYPFRTISSKREIHRHPRNNRGNRLSHVPNGGMTPVPSEDLSTEHGDELHDRAAEVKMHVGRARGRRRVGERRG